MWDFSWIMDFSAWAGLGTLVLLEVVLGVDNLVFISILVGRLPADQKHRAFFTGRYNCSYFRAVGHYG